MAKVLRIMTTEDYFCGENKEYLRSRSIRCLSDSNIMRKSSFNANFYLVVHTKAITGELVISCSTGGRGVE